MKRTDGSTLVDEAMVADGRATTAPAAPDDGHVILPDTTEPIVDDPFVVFHEWQSEVDRSAFAGF